MANPIIKIKRSAVAGKIPTTTDLQLGELAINTYDGKVYIEQDQGGVGVGTTVIVINPWSVGTGTNTYNTYFTAGSVGIGTTQPTSKLSVVGDAVITGVITATDAELYTNFTVTNSGASAYQFASTGIGFTQSTNNPTLYLIRGKKYQFSVSASGHPFWIKTAQTTGTGDQYNDGVTNNGVDSGTITFKVPFNAPSLLYYICQYHSGMNGKIYVIDAGIGPDVNINTTGIITASSFVKSGGTSSQFLKADGSVDSSTYATQTYVGLATVGLASVSYVDTQVGLATVGLASVSYVDTQVGLATVGLASVSYVDTQVGLSTVGLASVSYVDNKVGLATVGLASVSYVDTKVGLATVGLLSLTGNGSSLTGIVTSIVAGTNITISGATGQVTINSTASGGGSGSQWVTTSAGIHTLSAVGIGTTNPSAAVTSANTTVLAAGIVTAYKFYGDGTGITGISAVARVTVQSGAPSSPTDGDLWYHTTLGRLFVYYDDNTSSQWVDASPFNLAGGDGANVSVGATAPNAPIEGDLWYNSNYGRLFVYYSDEDSDQWVDAAPFNMSGLTTSTTYTENSFVATSGQTTFSVTYDVGYVEVYLNGIRLSSSEYTATSGNSIVLNEAAAEGDVVDIIEVVTNRGPTGPTGPAGPLSGIGTTAGSTTHYPIIVSGTGDQDAYITTTSNYFSFIPSSGTLSVNQLNVVGVVTATDFNSTSDVYLKTNIKKIDDPLAKVLQLNGVSFDWKYTQQSSAGVIAQDVEKVLPEIVKDAEDGHKTLNYNGLIGLLIEAIKEQNETIKSLEQKINTLEERLG
jgi:plastocyanin